MNENNPDQATGNRHLIKLLTILTAILVLMLAMLAGIILSKMTDGEVRNPAKPNFSQIEWITLSIDTAKPIRDTEPLLETSNFTGSGTPHLLRRIPGPQHNSTIYYSTDGVELQRIDAGPDTEIVISIAPPGADPRNDEYAMPVLGSVAARGENPDRLQGTVIKQVSNPECGPFRDDGLLDDDACIQRLLISLPADAAIVMLPQTEETRETYDAGRKIPPGRDRAPRPTQQMLDT